MPELPRDQLNILLVIARPYEQDVGFQTIARPMLEALRPLQKFVNLKVLRPPSFTEFEKELNTHRQGFYHIVHFDGHGSFNPNAGRQFNLMDASGQGELVFETLEGEAEVVSADRIAQSLTDCRVPVFVLNACKSAQEGEEEFSSVATRFIFAGAKGVVAMAYSVHAEAAKHFMARFYGELVGGANLSTAVAAARISVLNQPERLSPRGQRTLKDWLVPVLYQQEAYTPFTPQNPTPSFAALMAAAEREEKQVEAQVANLPEAGTYGFVGRSAEILVLERAFRQNNVVLLKGMGGVGKTQLALGFGRWLAETQGRDGGIFFTSFEQGATLSNVVNNIGRQLGGERFASLMADQQEQIVLDYLNTNPCLLIWDNFEPVAGFPAGNQPLLTEPERQRLQQWLKAMRGGKSWVLITSRRDEPWLDCGYRLVPLAGLSRPNRRYPGLSDSEALATQILQTVNVELKNLPPEYLELLKLLGGHPLSLRVVLPHLQRQTPTALIEALRQGLNTFVGAEEEGREKSLTVSLDYSFEALSERTRQHLSFLALFSERVDADWLHLFSRDPESEWGQVYREAFGENLQKADWMAILQEAAAASIVEPLGSTLFQIHPALPWYLRQRLSQQAAKAGVDSANGGIATLEKKLLSFYGDLADYYREQLISNAEEASFVLRVEEPNLLQHLRLAEQQEDWGNAQCLLLTLGELYKRMGRQSESRALRDRGLTKVGTHLATAKAKGKDAFDFWIYIQGENAHRMLKAAKFEEGEAIAQELLDELLALNIDGSSMDSRIAPLYHYLGFIRQEQRRFDEAIAYHEKSLEIKIQTDEHYSVANDYHHLGMIAQEQRQFDKAIAYYKKSLEIKIHDGNNYDIASDYHHLGTVAQEQGKFTVAISYFNEALKIFEGIGCDDDAAVIYMHMGMVAQTQRDFDNAISYFNKALKIFEDANSPLSAAKSYHMLGIVAQKQRDFDDAISYLNKALKIFESHGDSYSAAGDYHHLGIVAYEQGDLKRAIAYFEKALSIKEDYDDGYSLARQYHHLGIVAYEQGDFEKAIAYFEESLEIFKGFADQRGAAGAYYHLGIVVYEQGDFEKAISYFKKSLEVFKDLDDLYSMSLPIKSLGDVAKTQGDFTAATNFYHTAFEMCANTNAWREASTISIAWAKLMESQSHFFEALKIYIQALNIDLAHNYEDNIGSDFMDLGRMLKQLGSEKFKAFWQKITNDECPDEFYAAIQVVNQLTES